MIIYSTKQLSSLVKEGAAIDITGATDRNAIPEGFRIIGLAENLGGVCLGKLIVGDSGQLYAIIGRCSAALSIFS